jgi:hypothetical protein
MIKIIIISKDETLGSIEHILKLFELFEIFLISPKAIDSKYNYPNLTKINDDEVLNYDKLKRNLKLERFGWYYQQFLKYQSVLTLEGEDFLIIDGDTILSSSFAKRNTLFTTGRKTVEKYSNLYKYLFPEHSLYGKSFITNQMVFNKKTLKKMIFDIEKNSKNKWIYAISDLVKNDPDKLFSEYQVYAEYVLNQKRNIVINKTSVFRRMDLINDSVENAIKKYDILAYEPRHETSFLRILRAKFYYFIGRGIG